MSEKNQTLLVIVVGLGVLAYLYLTRTVQMQGIVTEGPATSSGGILDTIGKGASQLWNSITGALTPWPPGSLAEQNGIVGSGDTSSASPSVFDNLLNALDVMGKMP